MSGGQIDISFSGDEKDLVKAQARVIKQQDELIQQMRRTKREGTDASKANTRELEKFAAAQKKLDVRPAEKLVETHKKLRAALQAGLLTQEQYQRAVSRVNAEQRQAFGGGMLANIGQMALGFGSAATAANLLKSALAGARQEAEQLAAGQRGAFAGEAQLAQVADKQTPFASLLAMSRGAFASGVGADQGEAARLVFSLKSAGALGERQTFFDLAKTGLEADPAAMAAAAKALQTSMGQRETGNLRDLVSKSFGASQFSPSSARDILVAASRSGAMASAIGARDEEVLAATSLLATAAGGSGPDAAARGGTQLASLLAKLAKSGEFAGKGLRASIEDIHGRGMTDQELLDFFGDREAFSGFKAIASNMDQFRTATAAVDQAQAGDEVGRRLRMPMTDPRLRAEIARRAAANQATEAGGAIGTAEQQAQAAEEQIIGASRAGGENALKRWFRKQAMGIERAIFGSEIQADRLAPGGPKTGMGQFAEEAASWLPGFLFPGLKQQLNPISTQADLQPARGIGARAMAAQAEKAAADQQAAAAEQRKAAAEMRAAAAEMRAAAQGNGRPVVVTRVRPVANPVEQ